MTAYTEFAQFIRSILELQEKEITYATRARLIIERLNPISVEHDAVAARFNVTPSMEDIVTIARLDQTIRGLLEEMGEVVMDLKGVVVDLNQLHIEALKFAYELYKSSHPHTEPKSHEVP